MVAEKLKKISARDLLAGIFCFIPEQCSLHHYDISIYLIEQFDISAREINENLDILCGANYNPIMLKNKEGYYTVIPEIKNNIRNFIKPRFSEEQLNGLEKIAYELLVIAAQDYR